MTRSSIMIWCLVLCIRGIAATHFDFPLKLVPGIEVVSAQPVNRLEGAEALGEVDDAAYSNDGKLLAVTVPDLSVPVGVGTTRWQLRLSSVPDGKLIKKSIDIQGFSLYGNEFFAFSPDGTMLLFSGIPDATRIKNGSAFGLYLTDLKGTKPRRLTPSTYSVYSAAWRPDGKMIAFIKESLSGSGSTIAFVNPAKPGKIIRKITLGRPIIYLRYSPDGKWIAWRDRDGIGISEVASGRSHYLFFLETVLQALSPKAENMRGDMHFCWLPDSRRLLVDVQSFIRLEKKKTQDIYQIWVVNLLGEARKVGDGRLLGNSLNGKYLFISTWNKLPVVDWDNLPKDSKKVQKNSSEPVVYNDWRVEVNVKPVSKDKSYLSLKR